MERLKESDISYLEWLIDLVDGRSYYWRLLSHLHRREFVWDIPLDENRALDGKDLRNRYHDDVGNPQGTPPKYCTVLEMMIGLAARMDDIQLKPGEDTKIVDWFNLMLVELDLNRFTDHVFTDVRDYLEVNKIIDTLLDRTYAKDGEGGLFPLKYPSKDQRKVELWYQMNAYLIENFMQE